MKHDENKPLQGLILEFLEHLEVERNLSRLTIRNYHHYLMRFFNWYLAQNPRGKIEDLELKTVRKYRIFLSRLRDEKGNELALITQGYHVIALRSLLKWLAKNDKKVLAPEKIDLPRAVSRSLKFLTREQVERLMGSPSISSERGLRDRAILEVLFSTGMRVSEVAKLNRSKVDFKRREFGIVGKGGRARVVFLSERASRWLRRYFEARDDKWKPAFIRYSRGKEAKERGGEDMRLSQRSIQRIVEKYRKRAKLTVEVTPHGLRHTFATDLLAQGAGLREVQEMLGHKNVATTQIYTHVTNPQLRKVHKRFHSGNK